MRFKDLKVGKFVTNNMWLNKYWRGNGNIMRIIEVPKTKEDKFVTCEFIIYNYYFNKDTVVLKDVKTIQIPYIHLEEVKTDLKFFDWKVGDIIVPNELGFKWRYSRNKNNLFVITSIQKRQDSHYVITAKSNNSYYDNVINPVYFAKSTAVKNWNGIFANQYYAGKVRVEDGNLIVPKEIKVGSPAYEQIVKEAKACGAI